MPAHSLAIEFGAGLLGMIGLAVNAVSSFTRQEFEDDGLRNEQQDAVSEALDVLRLNQPPGSGHLIVHNGLSAWRRRR